MKYNGIVFIISTNPGIGILESQVFKFANYIALNYDFSVKNNFNRRENYF